MRTFFLLLCGTCLVFPASILDAQITIQLSDFQKYFYVGDTMSVTILLDSSVNVGQVGGPNVYDFSSLSLVSGGNLPVVLGSSLPKAASRFPNDTIFVTSNEEQAFTFTSQGMFDIGKVKIQNDTTFDYIHRSPAETIFRFPLTFGSSYSESITTYDTTLVNNVVTLGQSGVDDWIGAVDGYGTLKLPGGASYPCLRITKAETNCSTCNDDKEINFLTVGGPFVLITSDHTQPDTGTIRISGFQVLQGKTLTSVETNVTLPTSFALEQNYPNPFNPSTQIEFQIPRGGLVVLEVFDILGRKVATLVNEELAAGRYTRLFDAYLLPSGIYFDRLTEGTLVETSKMMLLK